MKVLYILKHNPWGVGGGCYASKAYLTAFLQIFARAEVDLMVADIYRATIPEDVYRRCHVVVVPSRSAFSRLCSFMTGITHRYQSVGRRALSSGCYDWCIFDHSSIAGSLVDYARRHRVKTVVINHNYEPRYFADNCRNPIVRRLLLPQVRRLERRSYLSCRVNIFLTRSDLQTFALQYGTNLGGVNHVGGMFERTPEVAPSQMHSPLSARPERLLITGSLGNLQNIDAVVYFMSQLYPLLPADVPLTIAGNRPAEAVVQAVEGKSNVALIASPPDMQPILATGTMYLCPARLGSGIKVRVLDGLRQGLPVLAHKVSAQGYEPFIEAGVMKVFETPQEFIAAYRDLRQLILSDPSLSAKIYQLYLNHCTFEAQIQSLQSVIEEAEGMDGNG
jgi:hypothetical protein